MTISDCCGAPCDGIEGAEEVGLCPACHEHCEWIDDEEEGKPHGYCCEDFYEATLDGSDCECFEHEIKSCVDGEFYIGSGLSISYCPFCGKKIPEKKKINAGESERE